MVDPLRMNPGSQLNTKLLGNTVELPEKEPLMGADKGPQSTARKKSKFNGIYYHILKHKNIFNNNVSVRDGR